MNIKIEGPFSWLGSVLADPTHVMFGLVNLLSATTKISVSGENFESTVWSSGRGAFLAQFDLASAMYLQATEGVDFEGYPWFLKLTPEQMLENVPSFLPSSETLEGEVSSPVKWGDWSFRSYAMQEVADGSHVIGNLGQELKLSDAVALEALGYEVLTVEEYLAAV